ncbi:MAG: glycosyltransferase family 2 protein [Desulfatiglandales bacterium]
MDISIIVVSYNTKDRLLDCLASIFETTRGISFEVWVVDNNSADGTAEAIREQYPAANMITNKENLGFAAANNQAFRRMNGKYAVLLNSDAVLTNGAVKELYDFMEATPEAGMACGQLLNQDRSKQNSIASFPTFLTLLCNETILRILMPDKFPSKRGEYLFPLKIDSCVGACLMVRKEAMDDIGPFDERYFFFFEETDWAYRMKLAGWEIYFVPTAKIFHAQGKTVGSGLNSRIMFYRSRYIFCKKWHPKTYPLFYTVILLRLVTNTLLSFMGLVFTLGFKDSIKKKCGIYVQLIIWHLVGCPEKR